MIPPKTEIGYDVEADKRRFTVTESGIVTISKGVKLAKEASKSLKHPIISDQNVALVGLQFMRPHFI